MKTCRGRFPVVKETRFPMLAASSLLAANVNLDFVTELWNTRLTRVSVVSVATGPGASSIPDMMFFVLGSEKRFFPGVFTCRTTQKQVC